MLPVVHGEFGVVMDPETSFGTDGTCWVKIRGAANDSKRDQTGQWVEGDPTFIDIWCFGKPAENLLESVAKGDRIVVVGKLQWQEREVDGKKQAFYRIKADSVSVSLRFGPAKTKRALDAVPAAVGAVQESLGATEIDEPPF